MALAGLNKLETGHNRYHELGPFSLWDPIGPMAVEQWGHSSVCAHPITLDGDPQQTS